MENLLPVIGKGVAVFAREVGQTEYDQTLLSHRTIRTAMRESWEAYKMPQAEVMKKKNCLEFIG